MRASLPTLLSLRSLNVLRKQDDFSFIMTASFHLSTLLKFLNFKLSLFVCLAIIIQIK
jgi:hypothetical protein